MERALRPFKFTVNAIALAMEDGEPRNEVVLEPVTLYGTDDLVRWAEMFESELAKVAKENG